MSKTKFEFSIAVAALMVATPALGEPPGFPAAEKFPALAPTLGNATAASQRPGEWGGGGAGGSGRVGGSAKHLPMKALQLNQPGSVLASADGRNDPG